MQHPYLALQGEYSTYLSKVTVTRATEALHRAGELLNILKLKSYYEDVSAATKVPVVWLMATNERESGSSLRCYLGNGQRLDRVTTLVPKGRGPFLGPKAFANGCVDALHLDHISDVTDWCWPRALYEDEAWNGFGPRNHGKPSGYLWSGTNIYQGGKYTADSIWNPNFWDPQLGTVPMMLALIEVDPTLALPGWPQSSPWPAIPALSPTPAGHDGGEHGVEWLQSSLNSLLGNKLSAPLIDDGSYGRKTRDAVRLFQEQHGLAVDGLAGPQTIGAVEATLASLPHPLASAA